MLLTRMKKYFFFLLVLIISLSCRQPIQPLAIPTIVFNMPTDSMVPTQVSIPTSTAAVPTARHPDDLSIKSPTPDVLRELPAFRTEAEQYVVQRGDNLGKIASIYEINVPMILSANLIPNPDLLEVGQELVIPAPIPGELGTDFKIIPDSELVYGPLAQSLDVTNFVKRYDSYLSQISGRSRRTNTLWS